MGKQVKGLKAMRRKMKALPARIGDEVAKALRKNADEMQNLSKSLVPVDEGDLHDAIKQRWKGRFRVLVGINANIDKRAFHARWVEFGRRPGGDGVRNKNHPGSAARPFFFPAYRSLRRRMRSRVTRHARKAIKQIVK